MCAIVHGIVVKNMRAAALYSIDFLLGHNIANEKRIAQNNGLDLVFLFIERNNQIYYICLRLLLRREIPYVSKLVAVVMEWRWTGGVGEMGGDAVTSIRPSSSV